MDGITLLLKTFQPFALAAYLCLSAAFLHAQSTFGTILGTVRDPGGSVISGAAVKLQSVDQNTEHQTKSSTDGQYEALNLQPGTYRVTISAPGFQNFVADGLRLAARQTVRLDASLQVGAVEQHIDVTETTGVIATDTAAVASAIDNERVVNLPVNYRASASNSVFQLIATLPGVQGDNSSPSSASFSINGALPGQASYSVDGLTVQNPRGGGVIANVFPSAEAVAEIKVQGVGNNAEYAGVGDVTAISRGGSNLFHGTGFWYYQNSDFDSTPYGSVSKPAKEVNLAGFSASGPVWIPKVYNGRNKSFFFVDYENRQYPRQSVIQNSVPTSSMRTGDFSKEPGAVADPTGAGPFPGNVIPVSRISTIATKLLTQFYPQANFGNTTTFHSVNYVTNKTADTPGNQLDLRFDQVINAKQSMFVRYSRKDATTISPSSLLIDQVNSNPQDRSLVVSHNYVLRPNLINEFRFGYSTELQNSNFASFDGVSFTKGLGFNGLPPLPFNGLPEVDISNFTGITSDRTQSSNTYANWQFNDNLSYVFGRHTLKAGVDIRGNRSKTALGFSGADNFGTYNFTGAFSGNAFADFLLGTPLTSSIDNVLQDNDGRSWEYHAFIQDSFHVNNRLTVEYGVRWQHIPPFQDQAGYIGNFDTSVPKTGRVIYPSSQVAASVLAPGLLLGVNACPGTPNLPANTLAGIPGVPCTPFVTAQKAGLPEGLRKDYVWNFYPRLGIAYRLDDKTSVRSSFGMFQMPIRGAVFYSLTGTAQTDVRTFTNQGSNGQPLFAWPNITTGGTGVSAGGYGTNYFGTANAIDFKNPYAMQWSFTVDRNVGYDTGVRVSYIGLKSTQLPWAPNDNQSLYSTQFYVNQPLQSRPFPYWGRIESRVTGGNAIYQAGQIEVNHRFHRGLSFTAAYTFAKNLNDTGGPNPSGFGDETGNGRVMDSLNRAANRGNDYATRRHRLISSYLYELPFGHGRAFAANANRFVDAVIGGWQWSGIFTAQSGPYMTPVEGSGYDPSGTGSGTYRTQRPDIVANAIPSNQNRDNWITRSAFVCAGQSVGALQFNCGIGVNPARDLAPIGRFGNAGVGIIEGPGTVNLSSGLAKYFRINERLRAGVEATFTNILNHTNLADPNLNITSGSFGKITSARAADFGGSRTGQVAVRFQF